MQRLCERPGCSDVASVAYGMRPEDLVFWLDVLTDAGDDSVGVLCRRHADAMVVPRDWTLDDLRDPDLRLFRPPPATDDTAPLARTRSRRRSRDDTEQLELVVPDDAAVADVDVALDPAGDQVDGHVGGHIDDLVGDPVQESADVHAPWTPEFDPDDDLGGLLSARSPLLARAFRGEDRAEL